MVRSNSRFIRPFAEIDLSRVFSVAYAACGRNGQRRPKSMRHVIIGRRCIAPEVAMGNGDRSLCGTSECQNCPADGGVAMGNGDRSLCGEQGVPGAAAGHRRRNGQRRPKSMRPRYPILSSLRSLPSQWATETEVYAASAWIYFPAGCAASQWATETEVYAASSSPVVAARCCCVAMGNGDRSLCGDATSASSSSTLCVAMGNGDRSLCAAAPLGQRFRQPSQ